MFLNHITIKKPTTLSVAVQDAKEAKAVPQASKDKERQLISPLWKQATHSFTFRKEYGTSRWWDTCTYIIRCCKMREGGEGISSLEKSPRGTQLGEINTEIDNTDSLNDIYEMFRQAATLNTNFVLAEFNAWFYEQTVERIFDDVSFWKSTINTQKYIILDEHREYGNTSMC